MSESLRRLAACANDFRNELLMTKNLLNVTNAFIFSMMQSLEKNSLKSIIIIHCQNILKLKRFWIWFRENTFDLHARNRWKRMFRHAMFINVSKFFVINFMKGWVLCLYLKCYEKKFLWILLSTCCQTNTKTSLYNAIFMIIDKCTKIIKYLLIIIKIDVAKLIKLFFKQIVLHFDISTNIINDKDFLFINVFWLVLCYYAKIKRRLSTAFHS